MHTFSTTGYNSYGTWLRKKYAPFAVYKVIVDAGFTCPNRDGTKGFGGCTYCNVDAFTPQLSRSTTDIREQVRISMERMRTNYKADKFIVYFQPNSNTYASVEQLKEVFDAALSVNTEDIVGLSVGTRPDCLDDAKLDLLESYADRFDVDLELGMESMYDSTLETLNRKCTHQDLMDILEKTKNRKFTICLHTIFGLPGETREMQLAVADTFNNLPIHFVKLHHLYISKGSIMGVKYQREPFKLYTMEEYADFLCDFIPLLKPELVIQRLFSISDREFLLAPSWGLTKRKIQQYFEDTFKARGIVQGSLYVPQPETV